MKVKTLENVSQLDSGGSCNPHLSPDKEYWVVGIDDQHYRVVNDISEPVLYPKSLFIVVDPGYPESWEKQEFEDGEYYIDPPEFSKPGFYEDYFDGVLECKKSFEEFLIKNHIKK